jgi:hypothetical protein
MKEVKINQKEVQKDVLLDIVFLSIKANKSTKQICNDLKISKQNLQYYLDKLKKRGDIQKLGYGVWQTSKNTVANSVRGHGFMWHIKLPKEVKVWDKILENKKINYKLINKNNTFQFYFKENKIWLSKNSLIVYDIKSYFGFNAVDSRKFAMSELRLFLDELQNKLGINIQINNNYILKVSRQHYALVKNALAIQCQKDGKKINVYNERGLWFTIDNSFNLQEAETVHPETSLIDNLGIQKYFNELKETKYQVTPNFILNTMNGIQQNQLIFAENMQSHIKAIQDLGSAVKELTNQVKILTEENMKLRK